MGLGPPGSDRVGARVRVKVKGGAMVRVRVKDWAMVVDNACSGRVARAMPIIRGRIRVQLEWVDHMI